MSSATSSSDAPRQFPNTRWSLVLAATRQEAPDSAAALEALCRAYWHPLYAYVRRCGQSPHDAQDLTQEFFYRLLEKRWLDSADRDKGKLRTFLIVALKKFMANEWRRATAQRRGGGQFPLMFDAELAESRYAAESTPALPADEAYDKEWALTLLELTMTRLCAEFEGAGKADDFEALKNCLTGAPGTIDYAAIAARLGVKEGAARVAAHRMRKRFREVYRDELSRTLAESENLDEELQHLAAALGRK